jgi:LPS-assembly protein
VIYNFTPDIGTDDNPRFDDIDRIRETSEITYSISNYFTSRSKKPVLQKKPEETNSDPGEGPHNMDKPTYDYSEFCRFKLSQTYDIKAAWENKPEPFSPIKGELDFSPITYLVMSGEAQYSRYSTRFVSYDASVEISDYRGDKLLLERRYRESVPSETVKLGFHLVMTDRLYAYGSTEHNLVDEKNVETELGLVYTAQCWSTGASYYDNQNEQRYRFIVNLYGLGELGHSVKNE